MNRYAVRWCALAAGLLLWAGSGAGAALETERGWIEEAGRLVEAAGTSSADATGFNRAVRDSRAALRKLVNEARQRELAADHRQLHSNMILLDVLLKSAASCQEGGRIVCPAMLMVQLNTVLKNTRNRYQQVWAALQSQ